MLRPTAVFLMLTSAACGPDPMVAPIYVVDGGKRGPLDAGDAPDAYEPCGACPDWNCPEPYRCDRPAGICYAQCETYLDCGCTQASDPCPYDCAPLGRDNFKVCTPLGGRFDASVGECPAWAQ